MPFIIPVIVAAITKAFIGGAFIAGVVTVVYVPIIIFKAIFKRLSALFKTMRERLSQKNKSIKAEDAQLIAFTLKDKLDNGDYVVHSGLFVNDESEEIQIQEVEGLKSKEVDAELEKHHSEKAVALYTM